VSRAPLLAPALAVVALLVAALFASGCAAASTGDHHTSRLHGRTAVAEPNSIGSAGDSITRAFDVDGHHLLQDDPADSWSTGASPLVDSQYLQILAKNGRIKGHMFNAARSGASMSALDGQLRTLAGDKVAYATVLMGDNDVCTSSIQAMTPVSTFKAEFRQSLHDFFARDAKAHLFVSSILNVYRLWQLLHTNKTAEAIWSYASICQSMLNPNNTAKQRAEVVAREVAFNSVLKAQCAVYANCRWDGDATFNSPFTVADVSAVDYFHPSPIGQKDLAAVTWLHSYWGSTK